MQNSHSPYTLYLNSLATNGRKSMASLLKRSATILGHTGPIEQFAWDQLTFEKVHTVRAQMIELGYAVNSVNLALAALRGIANSAFNLNQLSAENMHRIHAIKLVKGSPLRPGRRLTQQEVQQLIKTCKSLPDKRRRFRALALLHVGIGAGLRCAEICSLNIDDVDFDKGLLQIREGKGRKHRQIYVAASVLDSLKDWVRYREVTAKPLFNRIPKTGSIDNDRMTTSGVTHVLKTLCDQTNIPPLHPTRYAQNVHNEFTGARRRL